MDSKELNYVANLNMNEDIDINIEDEEDDFIEMEEEIDDFSIADSDSDGGSINFDEDYLVALEEDKENKSTENQYYKYNFRYSNSSIQDKEVWIYDIQPKFDEFLRGIAKTFVYQLELSNPLEEKGELDSYINNDEGDEDKDSLFNSESLGLNRIDEGMDEFVCDDDIVSGDTGESLNLHFQGMLSLRERIRPSTFKKRINMSAWSGLFLEPTINSEASYLYNTKSDTRVAGPWNQHGEVYVGADVLNRPNWKFQDQLEELMMTPPKSRVIYYIYDKVGGNGKSEHSLKMRLKYGGEIGKNDGIFGIIMDGTIGQMTSTICNKVGAKKIYYYDMSRSKKSKDQYNDTFSLIEHLKSQYLSNSFYGGVNSKSELILAVPHIVCFSNQSPARFLSKLSVDRWKIYTIEEGLDENGNHSILKENKVLKPWIDTRKGHIGKVWAEEIEDILDEYREEEEEEEEEGFIEGEEEVEVEKEGEVEGEGENTSIDNISSIKEGSINLDGVKVNRVVETPGDIPSVMSNEGEGVSEEKP